MLLPFQAFVTAYRPIQTGIGGAAPYGVEQAATPGGGFLLSGTFVPQQVIQAAGGYGVGALEYASMSMLQNSILDSNIYAAVESVRPAGFLLWVRISN